MPYPITKMQVAHTMRQTVDKLTCTLIQTAKWTEVKLCFNVTRTVKRLLPNVQMI